MKPSFISNLIFSLKKDLNFSLELFKHSFCSWRGTISSICMGLILLIPAESSPIINIGAWILGCFVYFPMFAYTRSKEKDAHEGLEKPRGQWGDL